MKFFIKIILSVVVLAVLLPFTLLKGKDGQPLMSLDKLKKPDISLPAMPDLPAGDRKVDLIYQWRDAGGELHFTNTPPPEGVQYTVKGYDPNTNLLQSVKPKKVPEPGVQSEVKTRDPASSGLPIGNPYSVEKVKKLMDDAENVQKLLDDRMKRQQAIIDQNS